MVLSPAFLSVVGLMAALSCLLIVSLMLLRRRDESRLVRQRLVDLQAKIEAALEDTGFETQRQAFGQVLQSASLTPNCNGHAWKPWPSSANNLPKNIGFLII